MKKIIVLSVALTFVSSVVWSNENVFSAPIAKVLKQGHIVKVIYDARQPSSVQIAIANDFGDKLFSETIRGRSGFMRPYDFSNLAEGTYWVTIADDTGERMVKVEYSLPEETELLAHVTRVKDENLYLLSVANKDEEALTITISNESDQPFYHNTKTIHGDFSQLFRVEDQFGDIVIQVSNQAGAVKSFRYPPTE